MEFGYATKNDINQLTELRIDYILEDQKTVSDEDMQKIISVVRGLFVK